MNLYKDGQNRSKHYYISDENFMLNYTPYEKDEYNGRCYFLDYSNSFKSQVAREGGLVRRRISKFDYEAALAECKELFIEREKVPAIDKSEIEEEIVELDGALRAHGTIAKISAGDMISDFDTELRTLIADPRYGTVNSETARHELHGFLVALKEFSIIPAVECHVPPNHFDGPLRFPQIGEVLPNGHTVDAAYCVGADRYVLAHKDGAPEPYAIWDVDQDGDTRNGRYFEKLPTAQNHFSDMIIGHLEGVSQQITKESQEKYKYEYCVKKTMLDVYKAIFQYCEGNTTRKQLTKFLHEMDIDPIYQTPQLKRGHLEARSRLSSAIQQGLL